MGGLAGTLGAKATIKVGKPEAIMSDSPQGRFATVFEDGGRTGYFYGLDYQQVDNPIVDALQIYNVEAVTDKAIPSEVKIYWSIDGKKAALLINNYIHAIFDFEAQGAFCRTGFPPPPGWTKEGHEWDEEKLQLFSVN